MGINFIMNKMAKAGVLVIAGFLITLMVFGCTQNIPVWKNSEENLESVGIIYRMNEKSMTTDVTEKELSTLIKEALATSPETATLNLSVVVVGSRITISGKAEEKGQIESAIKKALEVPGVKEVISTIVIDPETGLANNGSFL